MPDQNHDTTRQDCSQATENQDDWTKEVVPRLPAQAEEQANAWRKRLQKASAWLDWLLQEVLASAGAVSPWLARAGIRRIFLIDGTHWKCLGPKGMVWRVHTAFDLLADRLTQLKVTDQSEGEHLEVFELQEGDLVVTDRANGLRERIAGSKKSWPRSSSVSVHITCLWKMSRARPLM
jgi:hypothetical protein